MVTLEASAFAPILAHLPCTSAEVQRSPAKWSGRYEKHQSVPADTRHACARTDLSRERDLIGNGMSLEVDTLLYRARCPYVLARLTWPAFGAR